MKATSDEMRTKQKALRDALDSGSNDAMALGKLLLDVESTRRKIDSARKASQDHLLSNLTSEQKTKLQSLRDASANGSAFGAAARMGLLDGGSPTRGGSMPAHRGHPGPPPAPIE